MEKKCFLTPHLETLLKENSLFEQRESNPQEARLILSDPSCIEDFVANQSDKLYVISQNDNEFNVLELLAKYPINHLVGFNSQFLNKELESNVKEMRKWGVAHYLNNPSILLQQELYQSANIRQTIEKNLAQLDFSSYFSAVKPHLEIICSELLINSFFHSAISPQIGADTYSHVHRAENICVESPIIFNTGQDENLIAISIEDFSGKLDRERIINSLYRSFSQKEMEQKEGGAGLGIYLTYHYSNQFIVNFEANKKTEVICIIEKNKRLKKYKERITSFHFFDLTK